MAAKLSLNAAEAALVDDIFKRNDPQNFSVITGDVAVAVFSGSGLPSAALGQIWAFADTDNKGFLDKDGVGAAVRLIGHAQAGKPVSDALLSQPAPPPSIAGYTSPPASQSSRSSAPKPPAASGLPPLTPADRAKFLRIFQGCGPDKGLLSGDKARDVFVKSQLSVDKLSQIWSLADTKSRGALDVTDFTVAMYLVQALMSGGLTFVPTSLPPGLYEQAAGEPAIASHPTGGSFAGRPSAAIQPQYTGQSLQPQVTGSSTARPAPPVVPPRAQSAFIPAFPAPAVSQAPWDVTPAEKANTDKFFDTLDSHKRGYIEGDVAVPFLLQSKLPEDVLAQVWDLADLHNDGRLTREGFAIAMHLIQGKLAGKDVPTTLPQTLIPPSLRSILAPQQQQQPLAPVHELSDLLWDDEPAKPTQPALQPQSTGPLQAQTTSAFASPLPPQPAIQPQTTGGFQSAILQPQSTGTIPTRTPPLQPQSTGTLPTRTPPLQTQSTGTGAFSTKTSPLQSQSTGPFGSQQTSAFSSPFVLSQAPAQATTRDPFGAPAGKNLLDDDDDEPSASSPPPGQDRSVEIGNTQNQLHSTSRSLEITKNERVDVEARIAEQAAQLSALQSQLAAAKASYETETRLLAQLRERFSNQTAEIATTRQELIRAESDLSAARVEKVEVEQGVLHDKEEIRELQRKMADTGAAVVATRAEIERAKKEAKQQKGLHAIAKKQLATREAERAKADKELEEARAEAQAAAREREDAEAELAKADAAAAAAAATIAAAPPLTIPIENGLPDRAAAASPSGDSVSFAAAHPLPPGTPSSVLSSPGGAKSTNPFDRFVSAQPTGGSIRSASPFAPFANTSLPGSLPLADDQAAPAVAPAAVEDPFSFDQAFAPSESETPVRTNGEVDGQAVKDVAGTNEVLSPTSDTDEFSTPLTRPVDVVASRVGTAELELAATQFPPLDSPASSAALAPAATAPAVEERDQIEPDLGTNLMELEADESDSSDDEDDQPLAQIAAAKHAEKSASTEAATPGLPAAIEPATDATTTTPSISFDTAFGGGSPFDAPNGSAPKPDASPFDQAFSPPGLSAPPSSSKSAFDESFGENTPAAAEGSSKFTFDDAFEDSFDFASASVAAPATTSTSATVAEPAAPSGADFFPPPPNGTARHSILPAQAADKSPFGSAFAPAAPADAPAIVVPEKSDSNPFTLGNTPASWAPAPAPAPMAIVPTPAPAPAPVAAPASIPTAQVTEPVSSGAELNISFDEAFGGVGPSQALALDGGFGSVSSRASAVPSQSPTSQITETVRTSPTRLTSSPTRNDRRISLSSPPRESTPPPRVASPRPRPSTASSGSDKHDKHERVKEPRRGLSIRLPFGKKKKTHDAPPPPSHPPHLQPVPDEEVLPTAPAGQDDDIEPVKLLCGMGFSRTQAVTALEANGYDLQRALNSLVGTA